MQARIAANLAPYELESAVCLWLDTLRGIEETINLTMVEWDDEAFEHQLFGFPVFRYMQHTDEIQDIRRGLAARFSQKFANRFCNLLFQGSAIAMAFAVNGAVEIASRFQNLASMIDYLQFEAAPLRRLAASHARCLPWVSAGRAARHAQYLSANRRVQCSSADGSAVQLDG